MVADLPPSGRTAKVMKDNNTKIFRSPFIAHTKYRTVRDNSFVQTFIGRKKKESIPLKNILMSYVCKKKFD